MLSWDCSASRFNYYETECVPNPNHLVSLKNPVPSTSLSAKDRFEVYPSSDGSRVVLPDCFRSFDQSIEHLIGPENHPRSFQMAHVDTVIESLKPALPVMAESESLWLEYQQPGQFRFIVLKDESPTAIVATNPAA